MHAIFPSSHSQDYSLTETGATPRKRKSNSFLQGVSNVKNSFIGYVDFVELSDYQLEIRVSISRLKS